MVGMSGLCYVNGNFLIALDRGDPRALRFLEKYSDRLYTVANVMEEDVAGARRIAERYGITIRYMNSAEIMRQASIAARLLAAVSEKYTLGANDPRDIDHIAAAVATGAGYFVTSESKLCRWIREYRHITGNLKCIDWRGEKCSGEPRRDTPNKTRVRQENRENRARQGPNRGGEGKSPPAPHSRHTRRLQARQNNQERSRKTAQGTRTRRRKGKVAGRKQRRRRPRRGGGG